MPTPLSPIPPWIWLGLLALALLAWGWARSRTRRGNAQRARRADRAEDGAERLLIAQGFRVEGRQVRHTFDILVDGEALPVSCRADLVVRRRRQRFVAEVKSSGHHTDPTHPATRRQLLEYRLAFNVDGVLLVDMARGRITEVAFPLLGPPGRRGAR